jgi:hypothetical protein
LENLEKTQCRIAKSIQGMPACVSNGACCAPLRLPSIEAVVDTARLLFLWRIVLLPWSNIYKRVLVHRMCQIKFEIPKYHGSGTYSVCRLLFATATKYRLMDYVWDQLLSFQTMTYYKWKTIAKNKVNEIDCARWVVSCQLYKSLSYYKMSFQNIGLCAWWTLCNKHPRLTGYCKRIMKIIYGAHSFIGGTNRRGSTSLICCLCDTYERDTLEHTLFVCPSLDGDRCTLWNEVCQSMPPRLLMEINSRTITRKTRLLLSGYDAGYIKEWDDMFVCTLMFIVKLTEKRDEEYINMLNQEVINAQPDNLLI